MTHELFTTFLTDAKQHIEHLCKGKMSIATLSAKRKPSTKHIEIIREHLISLMNGAHFVEFDTVESLTASLDQQLIALQKEEKITPKALAELKQGCKNLTALITEEERTRTGTPHTTKPKKKQSDKPSSKKGKEKTVKTKKQTKKSSLEPSDIWMKNKDFVAFRIGEKQYAVPIFQVSEIRGLIPWTNLPKQSNAVLGLVNLRGLVLPLFDMRVLLGLNKESNGQQGVILILKNQKALQAFLVDSVTDVVQLNRKDRRSTPRSGDLQNSGVVRFIGQDSNDNFLMVVDIERITTIEGNI